MDLLAVFLLQGQGGAWLGLTPIIIIFVIFYVMLILPQSRRQKAWTKMVEELKTGDKVVTNGGLRGTIVAIKDDCVHLRVPPDNLRIEVAKSAVTGVAKPEEAAK